MVMADNAHHATADGETEKNSNADGNTSNVYLVGLEFVRQYYTVLNQGPLYLHRFYSDDSSFVHGASSRDNKVAFGQTEIQGRIQDLNFHNCHAKIRQVDSHDTLNNGVVIQVTGELSNNGQPMRRFMQTFVLAPQSPKRYYVRNDIFHYQDEVFSDDETDESTPAESSLDHEEQEDNEKAVDLSTGGVIADTNTTLTNENNADVILPSPTSPINVTAASLVVETSGVSTPVADVAVAESIELTLTSAATNNSGPKTYANLFKTGIIGNNQSVSTTFTASPNMQQTTKVSSGGDNLASNDTSAPQVSPQPSNNLGKGLPPKRPGTNYGGRDRDNRGFGGYDRDRDQQRSMDNRDNRDRRDRDRLSSRSSNNLNDDTGSIDGDRKRPINTFPDSHQIFVGNLPHNVTNQDIREVFEKFGKIAEIKIQKSTPKNSQTKVPYFCFVVFEDSSSAKTSLDQKYIFMRKSGQSERRLNVEEKRPKFGGNYNRGGDSTNNSGSNSKPAQDRDRDGNQQQQPARGGGDRKSDGGAQQGGNDQHRGPSSQHGPRTFRGSNRGGPGDRSSFNNRDRGNSNTSGSGSGGGGGSGGSGANNSGGTGNNFQQQGGRNSSPNRNNNYKR